ncbi:GTP-binding protein Rhes [Nephila pilipes]|uniref:GTP-binding protein Rhes n=1 Tax=Nephila pilipes TaxID=299642 RepID=A0A8X6TWE1_NEPPI|nr:GTP-binding protein Rhes [Nephila pilipes]
MQNSRRDSLADKEAETKMWKGKERPRVVVLGASGVGKTSIVKQFFYNLFPDEHVPTIEEMHSNTYDVSGSKIPISVLDTSGYYEFPAMKRLAIRTADAFVLVYAINDAESFERVSSLRDSVLEIRRKEEKVLAPMVIVGNKCDLEDSREVSKDITESVVTIDWENGFVEASAKDRLNIWQIFTTALSQSDICHALRTAEERRRKSLPVQPNSKSMHLLDQKRHSCILQ